MLDINMKDWKFATKIYKDKDDDVNEQFKRLKAQFKMRYKDREIEIKDIDDTTFAIETGDIIVVYTIVEDMIYQMYY